MTTLRVALIGGPQYDCIDEALRRFAEQSGVALDVDFRGDHPALNRHLAAALPASGYDLVSTHTKYVPSQAGWLRPLDEPEVGRFHPTALALARVGGELLSLPRNIDVRLLWLRRDIVGDATAPETWSGVRDLAVTVASDRPGAGFAFPGFGSGLFGTFYELTVAHGGHLFDAGNRPCFDSPAATEALRWLLDVHSRDRLTPSDLPDWSFDQVSSAFRNGNVAMAGDWPGYYGLLVAAGLRDVVDVARYPAGPAGRAVYAGCHSFAIPAATAHPTEALALLHHLTSAESAAIDAEAGMVPARLDVAIPIQHPLDRKRADLLAATIAEDVLTFPPLAHYPALEEVAGALLRRALTGEISVDEALAEAQRLGVEIASQ